jgi:DNA polymerase-4
MASPGRRILHLDMDAFYASVEQRDDPALRGRPVAVGGRPEGRGVVAAASYEARAFGIRSAMSMAKAARLCPHLVVVRPNFSRYREVSTQVFEMYRSVTPLVEPLSLDEAYLDVTENSWGEPLATTVAKRLKQWVRDETRLSVSAGAAPNKFLAKIASDWNKPDGLTIIPTQRVEAFLQKLPVEALWGVGPVTAKRLRAAGITQLVDVRAVAPDVLRNTVGNQADWLRRLADGIDDRPVTPNRSAKSSGSENTYAEDVTNLEVIRTELDRMARRGAEWLERKALSARTVTIKVRYSDFTTITRSHSERPATRDPGRIATRALRLADNTEAGSRPVRLLGVSLHNLMGDDEVAREPHHPTLPL